MSQIDFKLEWSIDSREGIDRFEITRSLHGYSSGFLVNIPGNANPLEYIDQNVSVKPPNPPNTLVVDIDDIVGVKLKFNPATDSNFVVSYQIRSVDVHGNKSLPLSGSKTPSEGISKYEWQLYDTETMSIVDSGTLSSSATETPRTQVNIGTYRYSISSFDLSGNQSVIVNRNFIIGYTYQKWSVITQGYYTEGGWSSNTAGGTQSSMVLHPSWDFTEQDGYFVTGSARTLFAGTQGNFGFRMHPSNPLILQRYYSSDPAGWIRREIAATFATENVKNSLIGTVIGEAHQYPLNGVHTDGYWYIRL